MAQIDVDALRSYLLDYYGSAVFTSSPVAIVSLGDVERASGEELCRIAERLGIDLRQYSLR